MFTVPPHSAAHVHPLTDLGDTVYSTVEFMAVYLIKGQPRRLYIVFISQQDLESNQAFPRNQIKHIHLPLPAFTCANLGVLSALYVYMWVCVFFVFFFRVDIHVVAVLTFQRRPGAISLR